MSAFNKHFGAPWFRALFADSFRSFLSGLGEFGRDKGSTTVPYLNVLSPRDLVNLYRGDWLSRKVVDVPAFDSTRGWRQWQADKDQISDLEETERQFGLQKKVLEGMTKARLYGGSAMIVGVVEDATKPKKDWQDESVERARREMRDRDVKPDVIDRVTRNSSFLSEIDLDKVGKDSLKFVHVVERYMISAGARVRDITSPYFGEPNYYMRSNMPTPPAPGGVEPIESLAKELGYDEGSTMFIHPSRVVRLVGNDYPDIEQAPDAWGDSVLQPIYDAIKDTNLVTQSTAALVTRANVNVIKVPGLTNNLQTTEGSRRLTNRFAGANAQQSIVNAILLDKDEEWEQLQVHFGEMPQLLSMYLMIAAGAADIPATRLLGREPAGMNATGESDLRNYYDRIASDQKVRMTPLLSRLDEVLIRHTFGERDDKIDYQWKSLWQITPESKATIGFQKAQAYNIDVQSGLMDPEALRKGRENQLIEDETYPGFEQALEEAEQAREQDLDESQLYSQFGEMQPMQPEGSMFSQFGEQKQLPPSEGSMFSKFGEGPQQPQAEGSMFSQFGGGKGSKDGWDDDDPGGGGGPTGGSNGPPPAPGNGSMPPPPRHQQQALAWYAPLRARKVKNSNPDVNYGPDEYPNRKYIPPPRELDDAALTAAGVLFVTPQGRALFMRRKDTGEWSLPAGEVEDGETLQHAAQREAAEETGYPGDWRLVQVDGRTTDDVDFATFLQRVEAEFDPILNDEHDAHEWADVLHPPQPLHPGLAATLNKPVDEEVEVRDDKDPLGHGSEARGGAQKKKELFKGLTRLGRKTMAHALAGKGGGKSIKDPAAHYKSEAFGSFGRLGFVAGDAKDPLGHGSEKRGGGQPLDIHGNPRPLTILERRQRAAAKRAETVARRKAGKKPWGYEPGDRPPRDWYGIGHKEGSEGKAPRPPEHFGARQSYMRGHEAGQSGGPSTDPFLQRDEAVGHEFRGNQYTQGVGGFVAGDAKDADWDESKHPRGQPGNAGQFGSGGGGGQASVSNLPGNANLRNLRNTIGHGYSASAHLVNGVIHTDNVLDATRALYEGRKVELNQPRQLSTLLGHLGKVAAKMIELGKEAPLFDLCKVSVKGTNLFCAESHGIPRIKMPQLPEGEAGEEQFRQFLKSRGYKWEHTEEDAAYLKATQNELNGVKVAKLAKIFMAGQRKPYSLFVSRDNYIIDGHHRWAADVGLEASRGAFHGVKIGVDRIDAGIIELLHMANLFTGKKGRVSAASGKGSRDRAMLSQDEVDYTDDWDDGTNIEHQKTSCGECVMYRPPIRCSLVAGKISSAGHCDRFYAKHSEDADWDESKHPRGQPHNAGQFGSGGGGGSERERHRGTTSPLSGAALAQRVRGRPRVREIIARHNELIERARAANIAGAASLPTIGYRAQRHEAEARLNRVKALLAPHAVQLGEDLTKITVHAPARRLRAAAAVSPPAAPPPAAVVSPSPAPAAPIPATPATPATPTPAVERPAVSQPPSDADLRNVGIRADAIALSYLHRHWQGMGRPNAKQLRNWFGGGIGQTVTDKDGKEVEVAVTTRLVGGPESLEVTTNVLKKARESWQAQGYKLAEYRWDLAGSKGHFSWIELSPEVQGGGLGKKMAAGAYQVFSRVGVKHIDLTAGLDGGGYAWAKFGFAPNPTSWKELQASMSRRLARQQMPEETRTLMQGLINYGTPRAIWTISDTQWGKKLLRGTLWNGDLALDDPQQLQRFQAYITKPSKQKAA